MSFHHYADTIDDASVSCLPESGDFKSPGDYFIYKKNPFVYSEDVIVVKKGCAIDLYIDSAWEEFVNRADIELSEANLDDESSFVVGNDYYIYLVWDGISPSVKISANSTYPYGYTSNNSRKIGGFHFGHVRKVSPDERWVPVDSESTKFGSGATIWENNITTGIVPNSVWDLKNRPKCSPEGMVKIGKHWVDIYLSSAAESITLEDGVNGLHVSAGLLQSKYGQIPVSGAEGLNWYCFNELAARSGKRMLSYANWIKAAYGNPQGEDAADNYGWTKTANTGRARTGCRVNASTGVYDEATGIKPAAISAYNVVDTVGNLYEWLDELSNRHDTTSWGWQNVLGAGKGQAYLPNSGGLAAYIAGASWSHGVYAGPRAVNVTDYPWAADTSVGVRLACDSL